MTKKNPIRRNEKIRLVTFRGRTQSVKEWSKELNIDYATLRHRLNSGWTPEKALTEQNRGRPMRVAFDGRVQTIYAWAKEFGIDACTLMHRLKRGLPMATALTETTEKRRKLLTFRGRTQSVDEWAKEVGICAGTLRGRLSKGWTVEATLTKTPLSNTPKLIAFRGREQTVAAWAREFGINYLTLKMRLKLGWTLERALTEPRSDGCKYITYDGCTRSVKEWADFLGIGHGHFSVRLKKGWTLERILTTPNAKKVTNASIVRKALDEMSEPFSWEKVSVAVDFKIAKLPEDQRPKKKLNQKLLVQYINKYRRKKGIERKIEEPLKATECVSSVLTDFDTDTIEAARKVLSDLGRSRLLRNELFDLLINRQEES